MQKHELHILLQQLIATWENEVVEFKAVGDSYSTSDIGKYFSALANEANLRGKDRAWLVFGVHDKSRSVVGTDYRVETERLHGLKLQISEGSGLGVTLREIHELVLPEGRVLLFEIPAAPRGIPIAWQGHYYARAGASLVNLALDKQDEIRQQTLATDWSAHCLPEASFSHLDEEALRVARAAFALKHASRFAEQEVTAWPLAAFLERAQLTVGGQLTRTAVLLLGRADAAWLLSPHMAQLTWRLEGPEQAYEHFGLPFLLSSTRLYQKIRNVQLRILPTNSLLAVEVPKYDQAIVLEALHNCIAHQDYTRNARVVVTEFPNQLLFENEGAFFEGTPSDYIPGNRTPRRYRNPFLVQAMAELNMIDTMGYGIHKMHKGQARRYFPMPDYDLSDAKVVRLTLWGGFVDEAYSRLLMQQTDLPLGDILALDRVQKKLPIPDETIRHLRRAGLIEGRKPHLHVSASVAEATDSRADYIRNRAQDDAFYIKLVTDYLERFGEASRKDINTLLLPKLSEALSPAQKTHKVSNLLTKMRAQGLLQNAGSNKVPKWVRKD